MNAIRHVAPRYFQGKARPWLGGAEYAALALSASAIFLWQALPRLAFAQSAPDYSYWTTLIKEAGALFDMLTALFTALALLFFFWGLALFILKAGSEEGRAKGRVRMVWGIVALFVIVAVWGLVQLLFQISGASENKTYGPPSVQYPVD